MSRLLLLCLLTLLALQGFCGGAVRAGAPNLGLSPERQKQYDETIRSARESQTVAVWCIRGAVVLVGGMFFYGAYSTVRHGFAVTKSKRLEGGGAWVIAVIIALVGAAVLVVGWLYAGSILP